MQKINLSPSFLSEVYSKGYDYAVGRKLGLIEKPATSSMSDGKLLHALIGEAISGQPDKSTKYVTSPFDSFRTKDARAWRDSQPDDTIIVSEEQLKKFTDIAHRVANHSQVKKLMTDNNEVERVITKDVNGFTIKGILDLISKGESTTVIDWKLVSSKNFDNFKREALYSNYDLQASVYDFLTDATHVYFGVIESESPHRIKLVYCEPSFLESGAEKFNKSFKILEKEKWREPNFDIQEVDHLVDWGNM